MKKQYIAPALKIKQIKMKQFLVIGSVTQGNDDGYRPDVANAKNAFISDEEEDITDFDVDF